MFLPHLKTSCSVLCRWAHTLVCSQQSCCKPVVSAVVSAVLSLSSDESQLGYKLYLSIIHMTLPLQLCHYRAAISSLSLVSTVHPNLQSYWNYHRPYNAHSQFWVFACFTSSDRHPFFFPNFFFNWKILIFLNVI